VKNLVEHGWWLLAQAVLTKRNGHTPGFPADAPESDDDGDSSMGQRRVHHLPAAGFSCLILTHPEGLSRGQCCDCKKNREERLGPGKHQSYWLVARAMRAH